MRELTCDECLWHDVCDCIGLCVWFTPVGEDTTTGYDPSYEDEFFDEWWDYIDDFLFF